MEYRTQRRDSEDSGIDMSETIGNFMHPQESHILERKTKSNKRTLDGSCSSFLESPYNLNVAGFKLQDHGHLSDSDHEFRNFPRRPKRSRIYQSSQQNEDLDQRMGQMPGIMSSALVRTRSDRNDCRRKIQNSSVDIHNKTLQGRIREMRRHQRNQRIRQRYRKEKEKKYLNRQRYKNVVMTAQFEERVRIMRERRKRIEIIKNRSRYADTLTGQLERRVRMMRERVERMERNHTNFQHLKRMENEIGIFEEEEVKLLKQSCLLLSKEISELISEEMALLNNEELLNSEEVIASNGSGGEEQSLTINSSYSKTIDVGSLLNNAADFPLPKDLADEDAMIQQSLIQSQCAEPGSLRRCSTSSSTMSVGITPSQDDVAVESLETTGCERQQADDKERFDLLLDILACLDVKEPPSE